MEYYNSEGNFTEIDVYIANTIAESIGVSTNFISMPFDELFGALLGGKADIVASAVTITEERQKTMTFSAPYMDTGLSIGVAENNQEIDGIGSLQGKSVGVLTGTTGEAYANESTAIDNDLIQSYKDNEQRLDDLRNGKLDAAIVHFLATPSRTTRAGSQ